MPLSNLLIIDPKDSDTIYSVTKNDKDQTSKILRSEDGGKNWNFMSEEFTEKQQVVMDVVFDSNGDIIYAGTDDNFIKGKFATK